MTDFANTGQRRFPYKSLETKLLVYTSAKLTSPTPDIHRSFLITSISFKVRGAKKAHCSDA